MRPRSILLAILLATPAFLMAPAASAQEPGAAACGSSSDPAILAIDSPLAGNDASAATPAAGVATGDCFFAIAIPGGPEANVGKELHISITSTENHDLFVARGARVPTAAPYVCSSAATTATSDACRVYWPLTQSAYTVRVARIAAGVGDFTISASIVSAPAAGCSHGYAIAPLSLASAQSVTVAAAAGSRCYFSFVPNAGDDIAKVVGTGLPSSLGSYVIAKGGDVPTPTTVPGTSNTGDYGCSPPITGTTRTCAGAIAGGEAWYAVLIRGSAITTTPTPFGITASTLSQCSLGPGNHPVALDTPITASVDGSIAALSCRFQLPVDQAQSLSKWSVVSNGANVDLYLRGGVPVATGLYDCGAAGTSVSGTDTCAVPIAGIDDVYASVYRPAAGATLGSFTLTVSAVEGCPGADGLNELATGAVIVASLADLPGAACSFHYVPDPDDSTVRVSAAPSLGSQTLLVKRGSAPTPASFDCSASATTAAPAVCDLENLGDEVFATLRRVSGAGEASVSAIGLSPCSLGGSDVPLVAGIAVSAELTADENGACRFKLEVPVGAGDGVSFEATPAEGDFDLFLRKGARPTASAFDCRSNVREAAATESCLSVLDAGTYYAMVQRVDGSGLFSIRADAISSCSLGPAASDLASGVAVVGSLLNASGAKCYFAFTPGNPLADPANPGNDLVKLDLASDAANNFDLFLRKGAVPSTTTRDCASTKAAGVVDSCELLVADGSTYYALVRRTNGSGDFSIVASTASSCALGPGYHALPNGLDVKSTTRQITGAKCYFVLPSAAKDDLLSIAQTVDPTTALTSFTLTLAQDHPASVPPAACTGTSYYLPISGLVLQQAAQCDVLLEDGLPHTWYASVARTSGSAPDGAAFTIKGSAIQIPTLQPGIAQLGHVETGTTQYWKVVLPENATFLDIQTAGDPSNLGCALGGQVNALVSTACLLLPFPKLVGCALVAGYGVDCNDTELTLEQHCIAQTGDPAACAQLEDARLQACSALNDVQNGTCPASSGSATAACAPVNDAAGAGTCDPNNASVKTTEMDLIVRHRHGLPTTSVNDCRSATPGATERCLFSDDVKEVHDNTTEPARQDANEQIANATGIVAGNRTAIDQAIADLKAAIAENRSSVIEPLWATLRELVFGATGQDPGALPATPAIPATPGTPGAAVPDQTNALPLPGAGKYFIAVRGPLDLASSLFYKGGDYAIVALHDDVQAPTRDDLEAQADAVLANLDSSLAELCARGGQPAACEGLGSLAPTLCAALNDTGVPCLVPDVAGLSATGAQQAACDAVGDLELPCEPLDNSVAGVCGLLGDGCGLIDEVLVAAGEIVAKVGDLLGSEPTGLLPDVPSGRTGVKVNGGGVHVWVFGEHVKVL